MRRLGIAAVGLAFVTFLLPAAPTPVAQAAFETPGGIAALPSSMPAVPGLYNQGIPAVIGSGQPAIVAVFCFSPALPFASGICPHSEGEVGTITFEMERLYPQNSGPPALTFHATGTNSLVVADNSSADMDAAIGIVAVQVDAGTGVNEVVKVTATDETGDSRSINIVVVDTILAWGPTGAVTHNGPVFISYHCNVVGQSPLPAELEEVIPNLVVPGPADPDGDGIQGLDDMYDGYYSSVFDGIGPGQGYGSDTPSGDVDLPDVWCGGNTPALSDDFVNFQTDLGIFTVDPDAVKVQHYSQQLAETGIGGGHFLGYFYPPVLDPDCADGKVIYVFDVDALHVWAAFLANHFPVPPTGAPGGCDVDGWRNTVVTTEVWPGSDIGVATITAQQGGGGSPPRTVNVTFVDPYVGGIADLPPLASAPGASTPGLGGATYAVLAGAAAGVLAFAVLATLTVKKRGAR